MEESKLETSQKDEWTTVHYRGRGKEVKLHRKYWEGFDKNGNEIWHIELSDGRILTSQDAEFKKFLK